MSASISTDKLRGIRNGGSPAPTTVSSARSIGGTTLSCVALTNWFTATPVDFITYRKKADGTMDRTTLCVWEGIAVGATIGSMTLKSGTDAGNSVGDFVEAAPTDAWAQGIYDWGSLQHTTDGGHKNITTDTLTVSSNVTLPTGSIGTTALADGAVKASKLDFTTLKLGYTATTTGTSTASTTYIEVTSLATAVTIPSGVSQLKITFFSKNLYNQSTNSAFISIWDGAVGSGTLLAESQSATTSSGSTNIGICMACPLVSAGSKTYRVGIKSGAGNSAFDASATAPAFLLVEAI